MSKQTSSRKKKLDQAQPIAQPSINPSPHPKINPHICLISPTYQVNTINDYRCFMKKRKYSKKIEYPGSPYANSPVSKYILKSVRKMKYLQGYQTKMTQHYHTQHYHTHERLCRIKRRVRSIHMDLTIYSHLHTFKDAFAKKLKGLPNLNLTSLKVQLYYSNHTDEILSKAHEVLANYLKYMSNLKTFTFMLGRPPYDEFPGAGTFNQGLVSKKVSSKFKRLRKIENLALLVFGRFPNCDSFAQDFNYLSNLRSINVNFMATTQSQGKQLIQNLSKIQTLTSVTLNHYCEPDDILLLAIKVPSLRSIIIKDDWLFDSKEMPSRSLINGKGLNIVQLHFDFPMDIDSDSDVEFVVNFLTAFPQLQSLHLHIQSGGENEAILAPIGKQINKFSQLQRLQLGVLSYSKGIVSPFLSPINRLSNLKEISLTLKRDCQQGWDVEIQELYQALKIFLLQSKELKQLNLAWDKFNQQCAECFKLIINEIEPLNLNSIRFKYLPPNTKHDKPHDKILRVFENLFVKSSVEIKDLDIATYCGGHHAQDCSYKMQKIQKAIQSNKKIKNFTFIGKKYNLFSKYDN